MTECPACDAENPGGPVCTACGTDLAPAGGGRSASARGPVADGGTDRPVSEDDPDRRVPDDDAEPVPAGDLDGPGPATGGAGPDGRSGLGADYDPDEEREWFEQRFGIDVGDRTVDEFIEHLDRQDYSATPWFWLVVVTEVAGPVAFAFVVLGDLSLAVDAGLVFTVVSAGLAVAVFADTRVVGLFRRWAKIRWAYVLLAAVPLVGHITGFLYLVLRRLKHEQTVEYRRRLLDSGFDVGLGDD